METLLAQIAELHLRSAELKKTIAILPSVDGARLRSCVYELESAIYIMERNAADAYRALMMMAGEAQA